MLCVVLVDQLGQPQPTGHAGGAATDDDDVRLHLRTFNVGQWFTKYDHVRAFLLQTAAWTSNNLCDADEMWRAPSIDENSLELNALGLLHFLDQRRHDVAQLSDDSDIGNLEDRCLRVFIDRDDTASALHAYDVLDRSADAQ